MDEAGRREAGLLIPLFALRDARDWGIGDIGLLGPFAAWAAAAGHHVLQLLPLGEMPPGERSPYAAVSAFAIDPIYLAPGELEDFVAAGGETALGHDDRTTLAATRSRPGIDYDAVRRLKRRALEIAWARFRRTEWAGASARVRAFRSFREEHARWLADYALFRACQDEQGWRSWRAWERGLGERTPVAMDAARAAYADLCLFHEYVQWQAAEQWARARRAAQLVAVRLAGDLPFMVALNAADVWAHQTEFVLDASLGAPPDAFNAAGQEWGLPPYRWDVIAAGGFAWPRHRGAHAAALYDVVRIDHVVGFYRMYVIAPGQEAGFVPAGEDEQLALGERLLTVLREAARGMGVLGEDLGVVPPFVRQSLTRLGVPGYRVLRWESDGDMFRDPRTYPALSVATTGTHDTSALATWWTDELDAGWRRALAAVPGFAPLADAGASFTPAVHAALLDGVYAAGSDLVILPFQDAYGGRERINLPATVGSTNWDYRLPWTVAELDGDAGRSLREQLRALCRRHGR